MFYKRVIGGNTSSKHSKIKGIRKFCRNYFLCNLKFCLQKFIIFRYLTPKYKLFRKFSFTKLNFFCIDIK